MKVTTGSAAYRNYEEAARKMDRLKAIALYFALNKDSNKIEDAKNEGKEEAKIETAKNFLKMGLSIVIALC